LFEIEPSTDANIFLNFGNHFTFQIDQDFTIKLTKNEKYLIQQKIHENNVKLLHFQNSKSLIWVSVRICDYHKPHENFIKIGYGDLLESNILAYYTEYHEGPSYHSETKDGLNIGWIYLRSITIHNVSFDPPVNVNEKTCLIDPFVMDYGPLIIDTSKDRPLGDLKRNNLTIADLKEKSPEAERLYENIKNIYIDKTDVDAITYSLSTPGCTLNRILKNKSYIRIPMGPNYCKQPGQPYVLEIWPAGNRSSIHNHGNAVAIIKVLIGRLKAEYYNSFEIRNNPENVQNIGVQYFEPGNITWMTPFFYQTHRLCNESKDSVAITIQSYAHTGKNTEGEYSTIFEYLQPDGKMGNFYPNEDLSYDDFLKIVKEEYIKEVINFYCKLVIFILNNSLTLYKENIYPFISCK